MIKEEGTFTIRRIRPFGKTTVDISLNQNRMETTNNTLTEVDPKCLIELINNARVGRYGFHSSLEPSSAYGFFDSINYEENSRANDDYGSRILFI